MSKKELLYVGGLLFAFLFVGNMLLLDYWLFTHANVLLSTKSDESLNGLNVVSLEPAKNSSSFTCPQSCINQIYQSTTSAKQVQASPTTPPASSSQPVSSSVREFYVSFGAGSNSSDDWQDVGGVAANVDTTSYGSIKQVIFEATIHIPTGNQTAFVRLYNVTDAHPVWGSELSLEGSGPKLLASNGITLDTGKKLYQVQMKTQLKYPAVLDQSRLHITTY